MGKTNLFYAVHTKSRYQQINKIVWCERQTWINKKMLLREVAVIKDLTANILHLYNLISAFSVVVGHFSAHVIPTEPRPSALCPLGHRFVALAWVARQPITPGLIKKTRTSPQPKYTWLWELFSINFWPALEHFVNCGIVLYTKKNACLGAKILCWFCFEE